MTIHFMEKDPFVRGLQAIFDRNSSLKPATVSKAAGLSTSAIRKMFENGSQSPKVTTARKIADVLNLTIEDVIAGADAPQKSISIAGKVGAGATVPVFDAYEKGDGPQVEAPPGLPAHGIVAVEVEGDSMEPIYSAGDLLFYTRDAADGVPDDVIGHRCVCEDEDGNGWVKQVRLGSEKGRYNLVSLNPSATNQHDVRLKWAARVRLHWPADLARKL